MKNIAFLFATICLIAFSSCKDDKKADEEKEKTEMMEEEKMENEKMEKEKEMMAAKTLLINLDSKSDSKATGKVEFKKADGLVKMYAKVTGLEPGTHAIHIHEKADCSAADGTSAGGHWNPTFEQHGKWGDEEGYHKGDIGNFEADANGEGSITMQTDEWCIGCGDEKKDIIGKSIIVHQGEDDFTSQPSGAAGARVSCGGIIQ